MRDLLLVPRPRRLETLGGDGALAASEPEYRADSSLGAESFVLDTSGTSIAIRHGDEAGRAYAERALDQIRAQCAPRLPALHVEDSPDFPVRGYMLDISRDRVPTRAYLAILVDQLALLRINHLELYTEHTFAYTGHEAVWRDASPMTADDVRWLDDLCIRRGIELCANQNTFGHMGRWLRHPAYRDRAETPAGFTTRRGVEMPATTLAPTGENAAFALELCRELLSCHSSGRINIGCDETFELGRGASAAAVAERGRARVYLEQLLRLLSGLHAAGHEVLFWGDILRGHPDLVRELPRKDTVALAWHYEAPMDAATLPEGTRAVLEDFGIELTEEQLRGFAGHVDAFAASGLPFWVCPGTSTWNTLIGRLHNARGNLLDAAKTGLARGASGYLITDWGDNGHMQPPSVSLPPLVYGAAVAWCADANRDLEIAPLLDRFVLRDDAGVLGTALETLGDLYARTGKLAFNASPLFTDLVRSGGLGSMGQPDPDRVAGVLRTLDEVRACLADARPGCEDGATVVRELRQAARLARHGAWRIARAAGLERPADGDLERDLADAIEEQRACWLLRSRPGGLDDSVARLERTRADYSA